MAASNYLRSIMHVLPTQMASQIRQLCLKSPDADTLLENLVRFLTGAPPPDHEQLHTQWLQKQNATRDVLASLNPLKRSRSGEDVEEKEKEEGGVLSKRQRTMTDDDFGNPIFTLHSISVTSPVRKKVDITVHERSVVFSHPSTKDVQGSTPLSVLKRAFIVPTRGKSKPHWTVIVLSSDIPAATPSENQQIIFGLDATSTTVVTTTSYSKNNTTNNPEKHPKNSPTLPHIQTLLSHLNIPIIHPSDASNNNNTFKSACTGILAGASASPDGSIPGVEAYRAAKQGNLWFSDQGILWGESKPCEFWSVMDLMGKQEGVRVVGNGRTCTVILTRRSGSQIEGDVGGEETEFGMVDVKERDPIHAWVRKYGHLFGPGDEPPTLLNNNKGKGKEKAASKSLPTGPLTIQDLPDESDESDEDFNVKSDDSDGSDDGFDARSSRSGSEGDNDDDEEEAEGGGSDEAGGEDEDEDEMLDPARHPLLRAERLPRMSKGVVDMVVGIVEEAFVGSAERDGDDQLDEDSEEDELVD